MTDIFARDKRSEIMSHIRSRGTRPEQLLFELVRSMVPPNLALVRNAKTEPGCPDVLIPSLRLAIFCHGCFFHSCPIHGHLPMSNQEYWRQKLQRNVRRDRSNARKLRKRGYSVLTFWEHDLKVSQMTKTSKRLGRAIAQRLQSLYQTQEGFSSFPSSEV